MAQNNAKGGGPPSGIATGDLGGVYPDPTVIAIQQNPVDATLLGATQDGYVLTWQNSLSEWKAIPIPLTGAAGGDLSGTFPNPTVVGLQGKAIVITSLTTGNGLSYNGTNWINSALNLAGGPAYVTGTLPAGNLPNLAGDVTGAVNANTVVKIQNNTVTSGALTKGQFFVATSTSNWAATTLSGDLSESSSTAGLVTVIGIQGNTVTSGALVKGNLLIATTTSNWASTAVTGDVAFSTATPGLTTVVALQGNAVASTAPTNNYVLTWNSGASQWQPLAAPSGVTWANDLSGNSTTTNTNQYVSSLSYSSSSAGGQIAINGTGTSLAWASGNTGPLITQTAPASGSGAGTAAVGSTVSAQTGGATTGSATTAGVGGNVTVAAGAGGSGSGGTNASGGAGGNAIINAGAGGAKSGTGTVGANGTIQLQIAGTTNCTFTGSQFQFASSIGVSCAIDVLSLASTSSGSGSAGQDVYVISQPGQNATGASHNGGAGGNLHLTSGLGGTSGSATAGTSGNVILAVGGSQSNGNGTAVLTASPSGLVLPTNTQTGNYTINNSGIDYNIFCNFSSSATITLPAPTNGARYEIWDIAGTAETNTITLAQHASEKISGVAASRVLQTNWGHWTITTNGTDWFVG